MALDGAMCGIEGEPAVEEVDARRVMAYAAGIGDIAPCYLDTRRPEGLLSHPMFPVAVEWRASRALRAAIADRFLSFEERRREVHASHDLTIHRLIRPGDVLTIRTTVAAVEQRRPGAYVVFRMSTHDQRGKPVCETAYGVIYRGVPVQGQSRPYSEPSLLPPRPNGTQQLRFEEQLPIAATAAHVYTECSRIFNPIHTDPAVAEAAGLPGIILHGTATLAMAVSVVVRREAGGDPSRVARIAGRFGAMVLMPSAITVRIIAREPFEAGLDAVHFEVLNAEGGPAVRDGVVLLR